MYKKNFNIMITEINTIEDVKKFARDLIAEGINFHPDDDFTEYVNLANGESTYTKEDAEFRNNLMNKCFGVCEHEEKDIYEIMMAELLLGTGLDKIIPLPPNN